MGAPYGEMPYQHDPNQGQPGQGYGPYPQARYDLAHRKPDTSSLLSLGLLLLVIGGCGIVLGQYQPVFGWLGVVVALIGGMATVAHMAVQALARRVN